MPSYPSSESEASLGPALGVNELSPDADRPDHLRAFRRNVRQSKFAIAPCLVAALATGVAHLTLLPLPRADVIEKDGGWLPAARWLTDVVILALTVSAP